MVISMSWVDVVGENHEVNVHSRVSTLCPRCGGRVISYNGGPWLHSRGFRLCLWPESDIEDRELMF